MMESTTTWAAELVKGLGEQLRAGVQYLPNFLGAVLALVFGWILARAIRRAMKRFAHTFNSLLSRAFPTGILSEIRLSSRVATIVGELLFWSILLVAVTVAAHISGLEAVSLLLNRITVYVPNLIVAVTILFVGYILSLLAREQIDAGVQGSAETGLSTTFGKGAQSIVLMITLVLALDQLGVDVTLLIALMIVAAAGVCIAFGVSFALGVRVYITNVIGVRTARSQFHPGQRIRIGHVEGQVIEITATQIALETEEGKTLVPGRFVDERVTMIITSENAGGADDE